MGLVPIVTFVACAAQNRHYALALPLSVKSAEWEGIRGPRDADACFRLSADLFAKAAMDTERALTLWDWAICVLDSGDSERGQALWDEAHELLVELGLGRYVTRMDREREL